MQFIDEAIIHVKAGDGGNGSAAFRREDGVPHGGPSGGDGGDGGSIIVVADSHLSSLLDFKYKRHYRADAGEPGRNKDQYGAAGSDLVIKVPVGTVITEEGGETPLKVRPCPKLTDAIIATTDPEGCFNGAELGAWTQVRPAALSSAPASSPA